MPNRTKPKPPLLVIRTGGKKPERLEDLTPAERRRLAKAIAPSLAKMSESLAKMSESLAKAAAPWRELIESLRRSMPDFKSESEFIACMVEARLRALSTDETIDELLGIVPENDRAFMRDTLKLVLRIAIERAASDALSKERRRRAKAAADALHGAPDGNRDKQARVRAEWASGKYTSRDRCAEEECAALGISFAAARKALRNTPDPHRA